MTTVFLSHSSKDKGLARRIAVELGMSGIRVWFDEWEILVGQSITQRIEHGLDDADYVVVLLTPHSIESGWVGKEWRSRVADEAEANDVQILPVLGGDCDIPRLLREKRYADVRTNFESGLRELIYSVRTLAAGDTATVAGARIESGQIVITPVRPKLPLMEGMIQTIRAGCFERHESGLRAHVEVVLPFVAMQNLAEKIGQSRLTLDADAFTLSSDKDAPTRFASHREFRLPRGELFEDPASGRSVRMPGDVLGSTETTVLAHVRGAEIIGQFSQVVGYSGPLPLQRLDAQGEFVAQIAV